MTNADLYIILHRHAGHTFRVFGGDDTVRLVCDTCGLIVMSADRASSPARKPPARRGQSPELKRFLSEKFPSHCGTSERKLYYYAMGRFPDPTRDVDVTLTHGTTVVHCNDPAGLKTAGKYLKGLSL